MLRRLIASTTSALIIAACGASTPVFAQWLKYPTPNVPRTKDGKVDVAAPTPRTADGKPDLSGIWLTDDANPCPRTEPGSAVVSCGFELPFSRYGVNIGFGVQGGLPYQPGRAELVRKRTAENSKDDPHARCMPDTFLRLYGLPHLLKFVQTPGTLITMTEISATYRQIFLDDRPFPEDPTPAWNGYSSAKWEGDTLVVMSTGFRDGLWLDMAGNELSDRATVTERIRRPDYGHLMVEVTVDDPKYYTKPWSLTFHQRIVVDTELVDEFCVENEKSFQRMQSVKQ